MSHAPSPVFSQLFFCLLVAGLDQTWGLWLSWPLAQGGEMREARRQLSLGPKKSPCSTVSNPLQGGACVPRTPYHGPSVSWKLPLESDAEGNLEGGKLPVSTIDRLRTLSWKEPLDLTENYTSLELYQFLASWTQLWWPRSSSETSTCFAPCSGSSTIPQLDGLLLPPSNPQGFSFL